MNRERIIDQILKSSLPQKSIQRFKGSSGSKEMDRKKGTTIIALKFEDGVLIAGDRRTSFGHKIMSDETVKIDQVAMFTGVGCAGSVSDAQYIKSILQQINLTFMERSGVPLTIEGQANYVADLLRDYCYYGIPLMTEMIICGLNFFGTYQIFDIWEDGCKEEREYSAVGSGTFEALQVMEDYRQEINSRSLNLKSAIFIALEALYKSGKWESGVSPLSSVLPSVATITVTGGFKNVENKTLETIRAKLFKGKRGDNV